MTAALTFVAPPASADGNRAGCGLQLTGFTSGAVITDVGPASNMLVSGYRDELKTSLVGQIIPSSGNLFVPFAATFFQDGGPHPITTPDPSVPDPSFYVVSSADGVVSTTVGSTTVYNPINASYLPDPPIIGTVTATPASGVASVPFTAPTNFGGPPNAPANAAYSYVVKALPVAQNTTPAGIATVQEFVGGTTPLAVTGLTASTYYRFTVFTKISVPTADGSYTTYWQSLASGQSNMVEV